MKLIRWIHAPLLSTWLAIHVLALFALVAAAHSDASSGLLASVQELYRRAATAHPLLTELPGSFWVALFLTWLLVALLVYLASTASRLWCLRLCRVDYAVEAITWVFSSRYAPKLLIFVAGLSVLTVVAPPAIFALTAGTVIALGISLNADFLVGNPMPIRFNSWWQAARLLPLYFLTILVCLLVSLLITALISRAPTPMRPILTFAGWLFVTALDGLLLAVTVFGINLLQGNLRRFFSIRYVVTWLRLEYLGWLAFLWLSAPTVLIAVFRWFVHPTLALRAHQSGIPLPWPVTSLVRAIDSVAEIGSLAFIPFALFVSTLICAKVVFELERGKTVPSGLAN